MGCSTWLGAQTIGLHPPEVDWQQLRGDHVRVLFPQGYEARAQRVASLVDWLAENHTDGIGEQLYDFDLILQTPNMTVNAYVGLAPFRSEFFVTPPQSFSLLSNAEWVDLLTIHEFRHVQQSSNERRGITKLFSYLQGQQGWAVLGAIAVPNWFTEGDAVITETALTSSGRGRTPAFSADLRALLRSGEVYNYAKARNGSYRDLVPDHYRYGYAMLTFAREEYGDDVWKDVLQQGAAYRGIIYPFSRALKRATGYTTKQLYFATTHDLQVKQDSALIVDPPTVSGEQLSGVDDEVRSYRFPFTDGQGRLLALRSSYRELPALVSVVAGEKDKVITPVGIQREPWLDGGKRFVVWTEYRQHPRYTNQNYSELMVYELGSGRKRQLTTQGHYLSASLSPDERQLVAVWYDPLTDAPELHLLDVATGAVTLRRPVEATTVAWPRFGPDGKTVYFLGQDRSGVSIQAWEVEEDIITVLRPGSSEPIDMLSVTPAGELLYTNGRTGVDNVYRLDPATRATDQLTDVAIGAYYPRANAGILYFSVPTPRGQRLSRLELSDLSIARIKADSTKPSVYERPAAYAAEAIDLPVEIREREYPITDFSDGLGGLKLHSWSFNGSYVTPGVSAQLSNALNTVSADVLGQYNINEARYAAGAVVRYGGLFTVVDLTALYADRNTIVQDGRIDSLRLAFQQFSELTVGPTLSAPLQWVSGNSATTIVPSLGFRYVALSDAKEETILPKDFGDLALGLAASSLRRTALRQVQPRLGLESALVYDRALGKTKPGERLFFRSSTYLPAPWVTHGIRLDVDYQREQAENLYQYRDDFQYARGYVQPLADWVYRLGANYQLPLLYPDIGGNVAYLKRIRLLGFFDYSRFAIDAFPNARFTERSVGYQLFFDTTLLNLAEISLGFQGTVLLDEDLFTDEDGGLRTRLLLSGRF